MWCLPGGRVTPLGLVGGSGGLGLLTSSEAASVLRGPGDGQAGSEAVVISGVTGLSLM